MQQNPSHEKLRFYFFKMICSSIQTDASKRELSNSDISYVTKYLVDELPPSDNQDFHPKPLEAHHDFYIVPSTHVRLVYLNVLFVLCEILFFIISNHKPRQLS